MRRKSYSQTEVQGDAAWNGTKTDDNTPHLINCQLANTVAFSNSLGSFQGVVEARDDDQGNNGSSELTNALHGEYGSHHGTSPLGGSELRGDNGAKGIVTLQDVRMAQGGG